MLKTVRIQLINPPSNCVENDRLEPPLGLLYMAAYLREKGFGNISVNDLTGCRNKAEIRNKISAIEDASIYGISCFSTNYFFVKEIIRHIRLHYPKSFIALGGPHCTGMPEFTLRDASPDLVVVGEGEVILEEAVVSLGKKSPLRGVHEGRLVEEIDNLPFPARDLVDYDTYSRRLAGRPVVSMIASRGCVHHCIHCNSVVMGGRSKGVRYRSAENIAAEALSLRDRFEHFRFNDDHFTGHPQLEKVLLKLKELEIKFRLFARIEDLNARNCELLQESGCVHVSIGLESLNPDNLKILGKAPQIGMESNVRIAKEAGLTVRSSFMVGLPFDDDRTILAYFQKAGALGCDEFAVYPLIPYPGTIVWKYPEKLGYTIVHENFNDYVQMGKGGKSCFALKHKNFGPKDVERWQIWASEILQQGGANHMKVSLIAT